jgi:hypothetical protein
MTAKTFGILGQNFRAAASSSAVRVEGNANFVVDLVVTLTCGGIVVASALMLGYVAAHVGV